MLRTPARLVTACLLLASAAAFATGVARERSAVHSEGHAVEQSSAQQHVVQQQGVEQHAVEQHAVEQHADGDAGAEPTAPSTTPATAPVAVASSAPAAEAHAEKLLGVDPEASGLVAIGVTLSVLLAALILTMGSPLIAVAIAATMLAFAALDMREVLHQLNEARPGLATLAAAVALLHVLAAGSALLVTRGSRVVQKIDPGTSGRVTL